MMEIDTAADGGGVHEAVADIANSIFPSDASVVADSVSASTVTSPSLAATLSSSFSSPSPPPPPPHELARQFDLRRPIRTLLPAFHQVTIPVRLLNAELTCIICLGIIRDATAVSECLHRFCHKCINQSLRHHKKECPQCRVGCPSHRNLRKDDVFDRIIGSIYPDLEKAEYEREKEAEALIDSAGLSRFAESAVKGAQKQAADAKQRLAETRRQQEEAKVEEKARRQREENSVYLRLEPLLSSTVDVSVGNISVRTRKQISVDLLRLWIEHKLKEMWRDAHKDGAVTAAGESNGTAAAATSATSAPRVRVSIWCRWSEMSDVSRQLWNKAREQPPPALPVATTAAATATNGADSNSLVIRLPKFPPSSAPAPSTDTGDDNSAVPSTAQPTTAPAAAVAALPNAANTDRMQDGDANSATSRKRKRAVSRAMDDVAGFVPHNLTRSEYCQLGNRTPLRTLPSAVLDDSRVMGGRSGGGSGARRITLLYQADEVDADGQLLKKVAAAAAGRQQPNGNSSTHSFTPSSAAPSAVTQLLPANSSPPLPEPLLAPLLPAATIMSE